MLVQTLDAGGRACEHAHHKRPSAEQQGPGVRQHPGEAHQERFAIVLAKGLQLLASGTGQTSRVDALEQAIAKANKFSFDLHGAVMASIPLPDCVTIAHAAGITAIVQPAAVSRTRRASMRRTHRDSRW